MIKNLRATKTKNVLDDNADNSKQSDCQWETEKQVRKFMSGMEKRECERKENEKWEMIVRNSELTRISEDRALAGFVNLTFDVDLVKNASERTRQAETQR